MEQILHLKKRGHKVAPWVRSSTNDDILNALNSFCEYLDKRLYDIECHLLVIKGHIDSSKDN